MIVIAYKRELFNMSRRNLIQNLESLMDYNRQISSNPEPYRVALFWLDVANKTWGWRAT